MDLQELKKQLRGGHEIPWSATHLIEAIESLEHQVAELKAANNQKKWGDHSPSVRAFIKDVIKLCKKHGMCISNEYEYGGVVVELACDLNIAALRQALDNT